MTATANITDVDEFTDPIVAPADGDAANGETFQSAPRGTANRTRWLLNRRFPSLVYGSMSGSVGIAANIGLSTPARVTSQDASPDYTVNTTADDIEIAVDGTYRITLVGSATSSNVSNPLELGVNVYLDDGSSPVVADIFYGVRASGTTTQKIIMNDFAELALSAGDKIYFQHSFADTISFVGMKYMIERVG